MALCGTCSCHFLCCSRIQGLLAWAATLAMYLGNGRRVLHACHCRYKDKQVGYMACSILLHEVRSLDSSLVSRNSTGIVGRVVLSIG